MQRSARRYRLVLSEIIGALIASLVLLSATAAMITLTNQATRNMREAAEQAPPVLRISSLNRTIIIYNPSARDVTVDYIVLSNGTIIRLDKILAPGNLLQLNISDAIAVVAGDHIYAIPEVNDSTYYPPTNEPDCSDPLTIWATVGLGYQLTYYNIGKDILCNPSVSNLSKTQLVTSFRIVKYGSIYRLEYTVKYFDWTLIGLCRFTNGACYKSLRLYSNSSITVTVIINSTLNNDGTYNVTVKYIIVQKLSRGLYVSLSRGAPSTYEFKPVVRVHYNHGLTSISSTRVFEDTRRIAFILLYYWSDAPVPYAIYVPHQTSINYVITLKFYSPNENIADASATVFFPAIIYAP